MYCKECGKVISDDSIFCSFCGTKQSSVIDNELKLSNSDNNPKTINLNLSFGRDQLKQDSVPKPKIEKYDLSYRKETDVSIVALFVIALNIVVLLIARFENSRDLNLFRLVFGFVSAAWRIIVTIWVVSIAEKQNRPTTIWGIFAFIFPNFALLIIGFLRKIKKDEIVYKPEDSVILNPVQTKDTNVDSELETLKNKYNIRFENGRYVFIEYKYDKLTDAINYAQQMDEK